MPASIAREALSLAGSPKRASARTTTAAGTNSSEGPPGRETNPIRRSSARQAGQSRRTVRECRGRQSGVSPAPAPNTDWRTERRGNTAASPSTLERGATTCMRRDCGFDPSIRYQRFAGQRSPGVQVQHGPARQVTQRQVNLPFDDRQSLRVDVDLAAEFGTEASVDSLCIKFQRRNSISVFERKRQQVGQIGCIVKALARAARGDGSDCRSGKPMPPRPAHRPRHNRLPGRIANTSSPAANSLRRNRCRWPYQAHAAG